MGKWQHITSEVVHQNNFFTVRRDTVVTPQGKSGTYHVIDARRAVCVIAITDDNKIILERQFRYPTQQDSWEIVAGGIEPTDETSLDAAKRELEEEVGYVADRWEYLGALQANPGAMSTMYDVYLCRSLHKTAHHARDEEGIVEVVALSKDQIFSMIAEGVLTHAAATMAPLLLAICKNKI